MISFIFPFAQLQLLCFPQYVVTEYHPRERNLPMELIPGRLDS